VHPPLLYVGSVGVSVAFAHGGRRAAARGLGPGWARAARFWTLIAWIFLTVGIALGSAWAYAELGWGGWWFWDPVENSALLPWLASTALLHALGGVERRGGAEAWTVLLAILGFSFSLLGMFLVRSGVLTSVHAFAADPLRGVFLLVLFAAIAGGGFVLFALRGARLSRHVAFAPLSRDGARLLGTMLLIVAAGVVLFGTVYPLIAEALNLGRLSVGAPFLRRHGLPLLAPAVALMAVARAARGRRDACAAASPWLGGVCGAGLLAAALAARWGGWAAAGFGLAAMAAAGCGAVLIRERHALTGGRLGMVLAHLGLAAGLAGSPAAANWPPRDRRPGRRRNPDGGGPRLRPERGARGSGAELSGAAGRNRPGGGDGSEARNAPVRDPAPDHQRGGDRLHARGRHLCGAWRRRRSRALGGAGVPEAPVALAVGGGGADGGGRRGGPVGAPGAGDGSMTMRRMGLWLPLAALVLLLGVSALRLNRTEAPLPSPLLGKPLPEFALPRLDGGELTAASLRGRAAVINVFASWCVACVAEHPVWFEAAKEAEIVGIAWMDDPDKTRAWLAERGNPYRAVGVDRDSRVALDLGVTGAPETYVVADGRIVFKYAGVVTPDIWRRDIRPLLEAGR
jgi:DsbE subfamily thiol:disulfide oxidoreductase